MKPPVMIHVAWEPRTGVWSVIKNLLRWQKSTGLAGTGVFFSSDHGYIEWLKNEIVYNQIDAKVFYRQDYKLSRLVELFDGTLSAELGNIRAMHQEGSLYLLFHDAHFSSVFLPLKSKIEATTIATFHGCPNGLLLHHPVKQRLHHWLGRRLVRYVDGMVSVDGFSVPVITEKLHLAPDSIETICNGVPPSTSSLKKVEHADNQIFNVGFIGALDTRKQWHLAAEAVRIAWEADPTIRFLLAGDGPEREKAEQWIASNTTFATYLGEVRSAAETVIPKLNLLILTSKNEGMPMVILESFACGIPVIASRVGGIPEIIVNGENGFLVETTMEPETIADMVLNIVNSPELYSDLKQKALATFESKFSIASCGQAYLKLFRQLESKKTRRNAGI